MLLDGSKQTDGRSRWSSSLDGFVPHRHFHTAGSRRSCVAAAAGAVLLSIQQMAVYDMGSVMIVVGGGDRRSPHTHGTAPLHTSIWITVMFLSSRGMDRASRWPTRFNDQRKFDFLE